MKKLEDLSQSITNDDGNVNVSAKELADGFNLNNQFKEEPYADAGLYTTKDMTTFKRPFKRNGIEMVNSNGEPIYIRGFLVNKIDAAGKIIGAYQLALGTFQKSIPSYNTNGLRERFEGNFKMLESSGDVVDLFNNCFSAGVTEAAMSKFITDFTKLGKFKITYKSGFTKSRAGGDIVEVNIPVINSVQA